MKYLTPANLILLFIIIYGIIFWLQGRRKIKYFHFLAIKTMIETFIMESDRENRIHAIQANRMMDQLRPSVRGRRQQREMEQLLILWRSKFKHLFNN